MPRGGQKKATTTAASHLPHHSAAHRKRPAKADALPESPTLTVVPPATPRALASTAPSWLQLPLLLVINLLVSALLKTAFHQLYGSDLGLISANGDPEWQLALTTAWKALELAIVWICRFDATDVFAFSSLVRLPHNYLVNQFYQIAWWPTTALSFISSFSNAVAVSFVRNRQPFHLSPRKTHEQVASDPTIRVLVVLLAIGIYSIPLLLSYATWLPTHLAIYYNGLKTLDPAHNVSLPALAISLFQIGLPAMTFLFEPASHALFAAAPTEYTFPQDFDPVTATLSQTLHRNILWHLYLPARTQAALKRTLVLMTWTLANTFFWSWLEIEGCELYGAFGWSAIWGLSSGLCGLTLAWVAGVLS